MSDAVVIKIPGVPVAKGRPRVRMAGKRPMTYTPSKTREWENVVTRYAVAAMREERGRRPFEGILFVEITFHMPIPASWSKKKRDEAELQLHARRPDIDNLAKAVLDALDGVVFKDDGQIATLHLQKLYAEDEPGVTAYVEETGPRFG